MKVLLYQWRAFAALSLVMLAVLGTALTACTVNPVSRAETAEQRVYAVYGSYVILEEQIADLVEGESTPDGVRRRLISGVERTRPVVESMVSAYHEYQTVLAQYQENRTSEAQLTFALDNMAEWVQRAEGFLTNLRTEIRR
jgi:hypothetical protein